MIGTRFIPFVALSITQLLTSIANAQNIYSKDAVYLFDGELYMQSCIQGAKESMMNIK